MVSSPVHTLLRVRVRHFLIRSIDEDPPGLHEIRPDARPLISPYRITTRQLAVMLAHQQQHSGRTGKVQVHRHFLFLDNGQLRDVKTVDLLKHSTSSANAGRERERERAGAVATKRSLWFTLRPFAKRLAANGMSSGIALNYRTVH